MADTADLLLMQPSEDDEADTALDADSPVDTDAIDQNQNENETESASRPMTRGQAVKKWENEIGQHLRRQGSNDDQFSVPNADNGDSAENENENETTPSATSEAPNFTTTQQRFFTKPEWCVFCLSSQHVSFLTNL